MRERLEFICTIKANDDPFSAFLALREKGCLLISLLAMMLSTGMPELQAESDLEYMRTALQLNDDINEEAALEHFRSV